ncbi:MAG: hypothetical protein ACLUD2_00740 [Clostridium sp.]
MIWLLRRTYEPLPDDDFKSRIRGLLLRQDNADLSDYAELGMKIGPVDDETYAKLLQKEKDIQAEVERLEKNQCRCESKNPGIPGAS